MVAAVTFRAGTKRHTSLESAFERSCSGQGKQERSEEYEKVSEEVRETVKNQLKSLYEKVVQEIFQFITSWDGVLIPAAILRCGYVDSSHLRDAIRDSKRSEFLVISPSTALSPVSDCVGNLVELFNELYSKEVTELYGTLDDVEYDAATRSNVKNEKVVLVFEKVESIPPVFLSTLISLLTSRKLPLAFIFCATADLNIVRVRCTRDSCAAMSFQKFNFGLSKEVLSELLCETFLSGKMSLELDVKLLETVCWRFTHLNYSVDDLLHSLDLAVLFHFAENRYSGDIEKSRVFLKKYWRLIHVLHSITSTVPGFGSEQNGHKTLTELHLSIQRGQLFNEDLLNLWKSSWLAYDETEMMNLLKTIRISLKSADETLNLGDEVDRCESFLRDLNNLEERRKKCEEETKINLTQSPSVHRSRQEMQKVILQKKELGNRLNVFKRDKTAIVSWIEKLFQHNLKSFCQVKDNAAFLVKYSEKWESCIEYSIGHYIQLALNPQEVENLSEDMRHLPIVYRTVLNWAQATKQIKVEKCLKDFVRQTIDDQESSEINGVFRRCLAELELFGIVKPLSDRNLSSIRMLHMPVEL